MKLPVDSGSIVHSQGVIPVEHPVLDAREIKGVIIVVFDYMAFPRGAPARNLFGYSATNGELLWRAPDIGQGSVDAYTNVQSEAPLVVGNFAGFACGIDLNTGNVISTVFTK